MQLLWSKKNNLGIYEVLMAFKLLIMHLSQFDSWTPPHLVEQFQHLKTACEAFNGMNSMAPASLWPWNPTFCDTKLDAVPWQADLRVWKSGLAALSIQVLLENPEWALLPLQLPDPCLRWRQTHWEFWSVMMVKSTFKLCLLETVMKRGQTVWRSFWIASYQELHLNAAHHLFLEPCKTYKRIDWHPKTLQCRPRE